MGLREEEEEEKGEQSPETKNCDGDIFTEKVIVQSCGLSLDGKGLFLNIHLTHDSTQREEAMTEVPVLEAQTRAGTDEYLLLW